MVHVLLKPGLENFKHYFTSVWDECNCAVVWAVFGIAFLRDWNEDWPFPVLWPLLSFPNLLASWVQHFHSIIFQDLKELNCNSSTSTSFVRSDASSGPLDLCSRMSGSRWVITPLWLSGRFAKSLQSCPTLCDPIDSSLPGSSVPGILQARILEWVAISFSNAWKWSHSVVSDS